MIGVRRFLGGAGLAAAAPPQAEPAPSSSFSAPMSPPSESTTMNSTPVPSQRLMQFSDEDSSQDAGSRFASQTNPDPKSSSSFYRANEPRPRQGSAWGSDGQRSSSLSSRSRSPSLAGHANLRSRPSSPPRAGPSSFRPPLPSNIKTNGMDPRASPATSNALTSSSLTWRHASTPLNTKDELLMSLLASQAVVDSKDSEILTADDVEELKRVSLFRTRFHGRTLRNVHG